MESAGKYYGKRGLHEEPYYLGNGKLQSRIGDLIQNVLILRINTGRPKAVFLCGFYDKSQFLTSDKSPQSILIRQELNYNLVDDFCKSTLPTHSVAN